MKSNGFIENKVYIREPTKLKISSYPIYTGNKIISRKRIPLTANIQTYTNAIYPNKTIEISLVVSSLKPLPNAKLLLEIKNGKLMLPGNTIYIPQNATFFHSVIKILPLKNGKITVKLIANDIEVSEDTMYFIKVGDRFIASHNKAFVSLRAPELLEGKDKIAIIQGTITIYGHIYWEDSSGTWYPLRYAYIELWDDDSPDADDFRDSTYVDVDGSFTLVDSSNGNDHYLWPWNNDDLYFKVVLTSSYLQVFSSGALCNWTSPYDGNEAGNVGYWDPPFQDMPDGDYTVTIILSEDGARGDWSGPEGSGTLQTFNGGFSGPRLAFQIYAYIAKSIDYVINKGYTPSTKVSVVYPSSSASNTNPVFYDKYADQIHVASGAEGDKAKLVAAYGMAILDMIYAGGIDIPLGFDPLDSDAPSTQRAFSSGWAYFFSAAVWDNSNLISAGTGNIEDNSWYTNDGSEMDGDYVAGSVASIFWDIHDATGENGWDPLDLDFSYVLDVIKNNKPLDIHEFWNYFTTAYGYRDELEAIYWHYGIDKDDDESPPAFSNPTASPGTTVYDDYGGAITLSITITDQSGLSSVTFHYKLGDYWYTNDSPTVSGDIYSITIPRSSWIDYIGSQITWYVDATDNDNDRPNDQLSGSSNYYYVTLSDDDTSPPSVSGTSTTGDITDAYSGDFVFSVTASDPSGWKLEVVYRYRYPDGTTTSNITLTASTSSTTTTLSVSIPRDEWISYVGCTIEWTYRLVDLDDDRPGDASATPWSSWDPAGYITDDDTKAPTLKSFIPSGDIPDSYQGDYELCFTANDSSGWYVYIEYWWSGDPTNVKTNTSDPVYSSSETTVIIYIPRSEWIQHVGETLYVRYKLIDLDNDRDDDESATDLVETVAGDIYDDDTEKPYVSDYGSYGDVYDSYTGSYYFYVRASDDSGWTLTVEYYYEYPNGTRTTTQTLTNTTSETITTTLYVYIPRDEWLSHLGATIYWTFTVTDNDDDRTEDSLSVDSQSLSGSERLVAGTISDDDTLEPHVYTASCNGTVYDNYTRDYYFWIDAEDQSGFKVIIEYYYSSNPNEKYNLTATVTQGGRHTVYLLIPRDEWIQHIGEYISWRYMLEDLDDDRVGDSLSTIWYYGTTSYLLDDDTKAPIIDSQLTTGDITDAYNGDYYINITVSDESGFLANISYWFNDAPNQKYYVTFNVYETQKTLVISIPRDIWINHVGAQIEYSIYLKDFDDDRTGDSSTASSGPYVAGAISDDDSEPPILDATYTNPTGDISDNASRLLIYVRANDYSGFKVVIEYWFSDDPEQLYTASILTYEQHDTVYVEIPRDLWILHINATLQYNITLIDLDNDRTNDSLSAGPYGPYTAGTIKDDDTLPPEILDNGTYAPSVIYDNESIVIVIYVNVSDSSGVSVELRYGWSNSTTPPSEFYTKTNSSTETTVKLTFSINKTEWSNFAGMYLWFSFRAEDLDSDRTNDSASTKYSEWYLGPKIVDDDSKPPELVSIKIVPEDHDDDFESDERIKIVANVTDPSGVYSVIAKVVSKETITTSPMSFNGTLWVSDWIGPFDVGNIILWLEMEDADNDRDQDRALSQSENISINILPEPTHITSWDLSGNYSDTITILAYVVDEENNAVHGINVTAMLPGDNRIIGSVLTNSTGYAMIQYRIDVASGTYNITLCTYSEKYVKSETLITLTVHPDVAKVVTTNISATYTDIMTLSATLLDDEDEAIVNRTVTFEVLINGAWTVLVHAQTNDVGKVSIDITCTLASGVYKARAVFEGDGYYSAALTYFYISVDKEKTYVTLYNISVNYSDIAEFVAYVYDDENSSLVNVNVTFYVTINDTIEVIGWALTNESGYATFKYKVFLNLSTYVITAQVIEDCYYLSSSTNATMTVNREIATILDPHAWIGYGDPPTIRLKVTDDEGEPVPDANVSVSLMINDSWIYVGWNITDGYGILLIRLTNNLSVGNYTLRAIFNGTKLYSPFNITGILTVGKELVILPSINATMIYNHSSLLEILVTDDEGNPLQNEFVEVRLIQNGTVIVTYTGYTNESGYFTILIDLKLEIGEYIIEIIHPANDYYVHAAVNGTLTVVRIPTKIVSQNVTVVYGEEVELIARLLDIDNITITGVNVTFVLPTENITCTTNSTGHAVATYLTDKITPGQYEITIIFDGTRIYDKTTFKFALFVEKRPTNAKIENNLSVEYSDTLQLRIKIVDFKNYSVPEYSIQVLIVINDEQLLVFSGVTNESGEIVFDITANLTPGDYQLLIKSDGNTYYDGLHVSRTLHVKREKTILTVFNSEGTCTDNTVILAKLTEEDGQSLAGRLITFVINFGNGSELMLGSARTNESGFAVLNIDLNYDVGVYQIVAKFDGDTYFKECSGSAKLTVVKETTLIIPIKTELLDCGDELIVRLLDDDESTPIENAKVKLSILTLNILLETTTDSGGIAKWNISLPVGNYTIKITFEGNTKFQATETTLNITIKDDDTSPPSIEFVSDIPKKVEAGIVEIPILVKVLDESGIHNVTIYYETETAKGSAQMIPINSTHFRITLRIPQVFYGDVIKIWIIAYDDDFDNNLDTDRCKAMSEVVTINVTDTTPPVIIITNPTNMTYINSNTITISWNASDNDKIAEIRIYIDEACVATLSQDDSYTLQLGEGTHTVKVEVLDRVGHSSSSSVIITIDITAPRFENVIPNGVYETSSKQVIIKWKVTDNIGLNHIEIWVDNKLQTMLQPTVTEYTLTLNEGNHTVMLIAIDKAGNKAREIITIVIRRTGISEIPVFNLIIIGIAVGALSVVISILAKRRRTKIRFKEVQPEERI